LKKFVFFILSFCLINTGLSVSHSQAAEFSGAYLLRICSSDQTGRETVAGGHTACQAYIAGVVDYHRILRSLGTAPTVDFCLPEGITLPQMQMIVVRYLRKNVQHDGFIAAPAIALALYDAHPCRSKRKR